MLRKKALSRAKQHFLEAKQHFHGKKQYLISGSVVFTVQFRYRINRFRGVKRQIADRALVKSLTADAGLKCKKFTTAFENDRTHIACSAIAFK